MHFAEDEMYFADVGCMFTQDQVHFAESAMCFAKDQVHFHLASKLIYPKPQ